MIEDDPDYVALVRAWLAANKEVEFTVTHAETLSAGMDRVAEGGIDLILLDLSLPDSDGPHTFRILRARAHQVPIILLSGNERESLALELVSSGAQDYLVKGRCSADVLTRAILYALVRSPQGKEAVDSGSARVIGVIAAKGGVGVTTLACVLAAELRRHSEGEALLVDLDVHSGGVAFLLGLKPTYSLLDALLNTHRLDEECWRSIVSRRPEGLDVLPSPVLHGQEEPTPERVRQLLNRLSLYYSSIVLDLGRLNSRSMPLLESMRQTVVVTSTALSSLYETRRAFATLRAAGCEGDRLVLAVSELPGGEKLSDSSIEQMLGVSVGLRLEESPAEFKGLDSHKGLPRTGSHYRNSVARWVRSLTGAPEEKSTSGRLSRVFSSWR